MAINSTAGAGITVTSAAKDNGTLSSSASNTVVFPNSIATNNGDLEASPTFAGRLVTIRPGASDEETRYMVSDNGSTTATVSEDWVSAPTGGESYEVSYIIEDAATANGLSLVNKRTNDYSSGRRFTVLTNGFFALLDGASLETVGNGSTTEADIIIQGRFYNGYLNAGQTVAGGSIFGAGGAGTADADLVFDCNAGAEVYLYDMLMKSVNVYAQEYDGSGDFQRVKFFSSNYTLRLSGPNELRDCIIEGVGGAGVETVEIDSETTINGLNLVSTSGFITADDATEEKLTVRDVRFVGNSKLITVNNDKKWRVVDPTWTINDDSQDEIEFENSTNNEVYEQFSFTSKNTSSDASLVSGVAYHIFESGVNLESQHFGFSNVSGLYDVDITKRVFTDNAGTSLTTDDRFGFFLKVYRYGSQPALLPLTVDQALSVPLTLAPDTNNTIGTASGAVVNGPGQILYRRRDELSAVEPFRVFAYDGGTAGLPQIGETIDYGAQSATLIDYEGDATEGILVLEDAAAPTDNVDITGVTSGFSATADTASTDLVFNYVIDANNQSLADIYDAWTGQLSNPRNAFYWLSDNGVETEYSVETARGDFEGVPLAPAGGPTAGQDEFYIGSPTPFHRILVNLTSSYTGLDGISIVWEYWDGTTWQTLSGAPVENFQTTGARYIDWTVPSDWAAQAHLTGAPYDLYIMRGRYSAAATSTQIFADLIVIEPDFLNVIEDGANEWTNPFNNVGGSYQTVRTTFDGINHGFWVMKRGAGSVGFLTDDNGDTYTPPAQFTFTLTGLEPNTEVRIYTDDADRAELAGIENSTTSFSYNYQYTGVDTDIYVVIHNLDFEYIRLDGLTLSNSNQSIPVQQRADRNYENP